MSYGAFDEVRRIFNVSPIELEVGEAPSAVLVLRHCDEQYLSWICLATSQPQEYTLLDVHLSPTQQSSEKAAVAAEVAAISAGLKASQTFKVRDTTHQERTGGLMPLHSALCCGMSRVSTWMTACPWSFAGCGWS